MSFLSPTLTKRHRYCNSHTLSDGPNKAPTGAGAMKLYWRITYGVTNKQFIEGEGPLDICMGDSVVGSLVG